MGWDNKIRRASWHLADDNLPTSSAPNTPNAREPLCRTRVLIESQGLHNWIQIYLEEKKGRLDYM